MKHNSARLQRGFTLIELLIYVAIFATMIGAVVAMTMTATLEKTRAQVTADLNYQGQATMAMITQTVHLASAISSPTAGNTSGSLTLSMPITSVSPTVFSLVNDGTTSRMQMSEGSPAVLNNLTNSRVVLSNLKFTNMSLASTKGSIQISFTLTYRTSSASQALQYSKNFYGAATIP